MITKFENFQKKCIKWILNEEPLHYSHDTYLMKCCQARVLPLEKRFDFNDLTLFYKIVNKLIPLSLPPYLNFFDGYSRLRSCHLDTFSLVSDIKPKSNSSFSDNKTSALNKSYFYRTHLLWNKLPLELRAIINYDKFRNKLIKYMWGEVVDDHQVKSDDCPLD